MNENDIKYLMKDKQLGYNDLIIKTEHSRSLHCFG